MANMLCRILPGFGLLFLIASLAACGPKTVRTTSAGALEKYVVESKAAAERGSAAEGSLWVGGGRRMDLFSDPRARQVNDIVTIRVVESTQANATADAKNSKNTEASAGFDKLMGAEGKIRELPTFLSGKAGSTFEGKGSTTRATTLETSLSARVIDVLPNGYLVVEGVRDMSLNNENQTLYLSGVIRPEDIGRDNVVFSSAVAQMTVRLHGRGVVSQPLNPGWLYKILTGILPF